MSSPTTFHEPLGQEFDDGDGGDGDLQRRMMRVKVLYTFDDQNKTNCLARLPSPLSVPVVPLDESTQIGVVELRTCIEAIVAASPELIAKLEHDYTVYAYDYSEYETPLVGQGMLSRVLASTSPTPNVPASESRTMITGRVCKNIMGLFSGGGVKETLEVKLKLVPVPSCSQTEYLKNMEVYRNSQRVGSADPRRNVGSIESLHDLLSQGQSPMEEDWNMVAGNLGSSRAGSPTPSHQSNTRGNDFPQSRPGSRMSMRQTRDAEAVDDQGLEDGPARKRARLTMTEWHGRASFGGKPDSLRVAASTSGSLRDFRPSTHITNSSAGNDQYPRAPTPRPIQKRATLQRTSSSGSSLRRQSSSFDYRSPYPQSEVNTPQSDVVVSPEDQSRLDGLSPQSPDLPSSPPAYAFNDESLLPSSPGLPELPSATFSTFQTAEVERAEKVRSGKPIDIAPTPSMSAAERSARERVRRQEERNRAITEKNTKAVWISEAPGPTELLPTKQSVITNPRSQEKALNSALAASADRATRAKTTLGPPPTPVPTSEGVNYETTFNPDFTWQAPPSLPVLQPTPPPSETQPLPAATLHRCDSAPAAMPHPVHDDSTQSNGPMAGKIALPPRTTTQGTWSKQRAIPRAQSLAPDASSDVEPDSAVDPTSQPCKPTGTKRGSANTRQKKRISDNLEKDVAAGRPPRICFNCGDPSPTTWRSSWVRTFEGSGTSVQVGVNGIHMVEAAKVNGKGEVTSYRVYKQWTSLTAEEKEGGPSGLVQEFVMCNACGNYVRQRGTHRPPQFWDKALKQTAEKKKKSKPLRAQGVQPMHPQSDFYADTMPQLSSDYFHDLSTMLYTDPLPPPQFDFSNAPVITSTPAPPAASSNEHGDGEQGPLIGYPDLNGNWESSTVDAALRRAIQSSPARAIGTSKQSPIELDPDLTSKPTNRLLFPSPRKIGEFKSLEDGLGDTATTPPTEGMTAASGERESSKAAQSTNPADPPSSDGDTEAADKENQPPPIEDSDELAHLFEELPQKTPTRPSPGTTFMAGLFKTPTPASKRTTRSTTRSGSRRSHLSPINNPLLNTPTRITRSASKALRTLTPMRGGDHLEPPSIDPNTFMTPMTAHLHKLLTDGLTSPIHDTSDLAIDFSDYLNATDYGYTDLPMPSSPPRLNVATGSHRGDGIDFSEMPDFGIWEDDTAEQSGENAKEHERAESPPADGEDLVECVPA